MPVNGNVGRIEIDAQTAADNRHPAFITTVTFPTTHPKLPVGLVLVKGTEAGTAGPVEGAAGEEIIGVLNETAEENAGSGNMMIHGSCPAEILKNFDLNAGGAIIPATATQIAKLQAIGIYV